MPISNQPSSEAHRSLPKKDRLSPVASAIFAETTRPTIQRAAEKLKWTVATVIAPESFSAPADKMILFQDEASARNLGRQGMSGVSEVNPEFASA